MEVENKKFLVVIWHLGIGGMQKRMTDVAEQMEKENKNWQLHFLVKYRVKSPFESRLLKLKNVKIEYFAQNKKSASSLGIVWWLIDKWRNIKPDVCLTFLDHLSVGCVVIGKLFFTKTKIVLNESMLTSVYLKMQRGRWVWFWKKMIIWNYPKADKIIVPTKIGKLDLVNNFGIQKNKIFVLSNWTNWNSKNLPTKKDIDLIYVGRLEKEKGIDNLQKIWRELRNKRKDIKMVIVGSGENILQMKREFGRGVLWPGLSENVQRWIDRSKILVLPTKNEGMPNVVLEAGVRAVPTVTSNFGGVEEIIENEVDGIVVNSHEQMTKEILRLIDNENIRNRMGEKIEKKIASQFGQKNQDKFIDYLIS